MICKQCNEGKRCEDCFSLIDGAALQKKLSIPKKIVLETIDGQQCHGDLISVSPVGLGIKVNELSTSICYQIKIYDNFQLKVSRIGGRGKEGYYGFDIVEVLRSGDNSNRLSAEEYKALTITAEQLVDEITEDLSDNVKDIVREKLKTELEKAKILDSLKVGQTLKYQKGILKILSSKSKDMKIKENQLVDIAEKCSKTGSPQREVFFLDQDTVYDVHGIPFDYQSGGLLLIDVSSVVKNERELRKKELKIYQEAIEAVTGGKLLLVSKEEIWQCIHVNPDLEREIYDPNQLDSLRLDIEKLIKETGIPDKDAFLVLVCISEAITNALKHANGGKCKVWKLSDRIRIEISDKGPGISFKDLPKATLMQHFSTTKSLGCGFTIMLKFLDKIIMSSDCDGTILVLEKINTFKSNLPSKPQC